MKKIILIFIFFALTVNVHSQVNNYYDAMKEGNKAFDKGEYKKAINFYFAAAAFMPENKGEVKEKVNKAFDAIEALRKKAEDALAEAKKQTHLALEAKKEAEKQKDIAQKALQQNVEFQEKAVGKKYKGGIIFYSDSKREHGLIAAEKDLDSTYTWVDAKKVCDNYSVIVDGVTYDDWHLSSKDELSLLSQNKSLVGGFRSEAYWSSSEDSTNKEFAWVQNFGMGYQDNIFGKSWLFRVRAVRSF